MWTFVGFPTYGSGPFERWVFPTNTALLVGFVAVCIAEVVVAVLLWRDATTALYVWRCPSCLSSSCSGPRFALPIGPLLRFARTALEPARRLAKKPSSRCCTWRHHPLSVSAAQHERRAAERRGRRATERAVAAVRHASVALTDAGRVSMSPRELLEAARERGGLFAGVTLRDEVHPGQYSQRAVNHGLTALVSDPSTGVTTPRRGRYRLEAT